MKLDSRIKEGKKPLACFDTEEARQFIGKECYFSCVGTDFGDLKYCAKGIMRLVAGECPFAFEDDEGNHHGCTYCLPCEWVSENSEEPEEPEESEEPEERDDMEDFLKIWFGCSSFGANGNLEVGKWSKLESLDLPFSKVPDSENPRVPF